MTDEIKVENKLIIDYQIKTLNKIEKYLELLVDIHLTTTCNNLRLEEFNILKDKFINITEGR